jgi:uncharacterized protein involved in outer membrane biogenesis
MFQITGNETFSRDTLVSASRIDVAVDLFSKFGGSETNIYSLLIDHPRIHLIVNKDGQANWNISKPDTSAISRRAEGGMVFISFQPSCFLPHAC